MESKSKKIKNFILEYGLYIYAGFMIWPPLFFPELRTLYIANILCVVIALLASCANILWSISRDLMAIRHKTTMIELHKQYEINNKKIDAFNKMQADHTKQ